MAGRGLARDLSRFLLITSYGKLIDRASHILGFNIRKEIISDVEKPFYFFIFFILSILFFFYLRSVLESRQVGENNYG